MARPATHHDAPASAPTAPRIRDFSGGRGVATRVEFDVRTVYDFSFSLSKEAGGTDELPATDQRWLTAARATLREQVGPALDAYCDELCVVLAGLAVDRPEVRTAAAFVDLIRSTPDATILRQILGDHLRDPEVASLLDRALTGDAAAIRRLVKQTREEEDAGRRERALALWSDPADALGSAREVLARWLTLFAPIEERVAAMLRRDVDLRAEDRERLAAGDLIVKTTGGVRWAPEPGVDRVILAPSYFARPYNYILAGLDWRLYGYPIADTALDVTDPLAPPASVVRLHRALGDETRLRILRLLRDRDLYLTEIAQLLELSKPTIKHHVMLLRAAGLVTVTEEAGLTYYSLRRDRLDDAAGEVKHFLLD